MEAFKPDPAAMQSPFVPQPSPSLYAGAQFHPPDAERPQLTSLLRAIETADAAAQASPREFADHRQPPAEEEKGEGCTFGGFTSGSSTYFARSQGSSSSSPTNGCPPGCSPRRGGGAQQRKWMPQKRIISTPISGTGIFVLVEEKPPKIPLLPGEPRQRTPYLELPAADQELMLQDAYKAVLGVCNALVPGNGLELMDALMETTDVYRKRYGYKQNLFDLDGEEDSIEVDEEGRKKPAASTLPPVESLGNLVRITPAFQSLGGSFWLHKDRYFRKRRCSFVYLARSQRARVIKATYELIQAVGEEFSPGTRLDLLDRVFKHHTVLRPVEKKAGRLPTPNSSAHLYRSGAAADASEDSKGPPPPQKRARSEESCVVTVSTSTSPSLNPNPKPASPVSIPPDDPLFTAAAHILAAHWVQAMTGGAQQPSLASSASQSAVLPPPFPPVKLPPPPSVDHIARLAQQYIGGQRPLPAPLSAPAPLIQAPTPQLPPPPQQQAQLPMPPPTSEAWARHLTTTSMAGVGAPIPATTAYAMPISTPAPAPVPMRVHTHEGVLLGPGIAAPIATCPMPGALGGSTLASASVPAPPGPASAAAGGPALLALAAGGRHRVGRFQLATGAQAGAAGHLGFFVDARRGAWPSGGGGGGGVGLEHAPGAGRLHI